MRETLRGFGGYWFSLSYEGGEMVLAGYPFLLRNRMEVEVWWMGHLLETVAMVEGLPVVEERVCNRLRVEEGEAVYRWWLGLAHIEAQFSLEAVETFLRDGRLHPGGEYRLRDSLEVAGVLEERDGGWGLVPRIGGGWVPLTEVEVSELMPLWSKRSWNELRERMGYQNG